MNAVDTNLIVYAHRTDNAMHERARSFLEGILPAGIGIPYHCLIEFLAIVTSPRIFKTPTPVDRAIEQVRALLQIDGVRVLAESTESFESCARLLGQTNLSGASVMTSVSRRCARSTP